MEWLKVKALSSNPSTVKKKKKKLAAFFVQASSLVTSGQ
jgi:hypothetical protein